MSNLYIAYIATWIIHLGYIAYLWRKDAAVQREFREFERGQGSRASSTSESR